MEQIFSNSYQTYTVEYLYNKYNETIYNHNKIFSDVFLIENTKEKIYKLSYVPISYEWWIIVNKYLTESDKNSWTINSILEEWIDFNIDYEQWIFYFTNSYVITLWEVFEIVWNHQKINLKQFCLILDNTLRYLNNYFPIKDIVEYKTEDNWWVDTITQLDLTRIDLLDVNDIYQNLDDMRWLSFNRRWKYIIFRKPTIRTNVDTYWFEIEENFSIDLPIYIEWNKKASEVTFNKSDIDLTLNQNIHFTEKWLNALILKLWIEWYWIRLHYSEEQNVYTLKLNTKDIDNLIRNMLWQLAAELRDNTISKWYYPASWRQPIQTTLVTNTAWLDV